MRNSLLRRCRVVLFISISAIIIVNIKRIYSDLWAEVETTGNENTLGRRFIKTTTPGNGQRIIERCHQHLGFLNDGIRRFRQKVFPGTLEFDIEQIQTQNMRRRILHQRCKELGHNNSSSFGVTRVPSHLLVDDVHKFMFCQVRKVSSISWRRLLNDVITRDSSGTVKLRRLSSFSLAEQKERVENYNKFVFVREPLLRVLSAWQDKFVNGFDKRMYERSFGELIVEKVRRNVDVIRGEGDLNITFAEFVKYLTTTILPGMISTDVHWQSYNTRCMPCTTFYDYIGHFENVSREAEWILNQIHVKGVKWPSKAPATSIKFAQTQYGTLIESQRKALYNLYKNDYRLFGYSVDKLWNELGL